MNETGVILHLAKSGRIIVKLSKKVSPGTVLLDERGRKLGKVLELIGPVRAPYASLVPATSRTGRAGDEVYSTG